jgi:hypothetical protein
VNSMLAESWNKGIGRPRSCGLYAAVEIACMYLRQNVPQEFIGDMRNKHGTTGFNAQLICLLDGAPIYISDPLPGKTRDAAAFNQAPVAEIVRNSGGGIGDKCYQGCGIATPRKTSPGGELSKGDKKDNAVISGLRAPVERVFAPGTKATCAEAVKRLVKDSRRWEVRSAGKGSKGERWYAWAWIGTASPRHHLLVRRYLRTGELAFHYCYVPEGQLLTKTRLIRADGVRAVVGAVASGCRQEMAAFTSSMTLFSTTGLHSWRAYDTGHMPPSSRFAASWKPRVQYR